MAIARTARSVWVQRAFDVLAAGGPDAVRVESLARAIGVTKGGFYWHFRDRQALLEEMLDTWEREVIDDVIAQVDAVSGDGRDRLRRLFAIGAEYAQPERMALELAVRDWARRDAMVAERVRRVDNRRMDFMRAQFRTFCTDDADVEARCLLTFTVFIGSHFIAADHGSLERSQVIASALRHILA
jgi:AcrR family transcriptional regulator